MSIEREGFGLHSSTTHASVHCMGLLDQADWGVFKQKDTWQAFAIAIVMFGAISFAALSMFDSMDELFQSDAEPAPIPNIVFESLNRSDVEASFVNETGWFNLNDHRGSVIILDLMAEIAATAIWFRSTLRNEMDDWHATANANGKSLKIFAYGAWYDESVDYLNEEQRGIHRAALPHGLWLNRGSRA